MENWTKVYLFELAQKEPILKAKISICNKIRSDGIPSNFRNLQYDVKVEVNKKFFGNNLTVIGSPLELLTSCMSLVYVSHIPCQLSFG